MNSAQRRKDRRQWKYHVALSQEKVYANDYNAMFDWCRDTFGNGNKCGGWREAHNHIGTWWEFTSDKKAALFALRWK